MEASGITLRADHLGSQRLGDRREQRITNADFSLIRHFLEGLGSYQSLLVLAVPLAIMEPLESARASRRRGRAFRCRDFSDDLRLCRQPFYH